MAVFTVVVDTVGMIRINWVDLGIIPTGWVAVEMLDVMVCLSFQGRLPKEELLFFLTHEEIGQLLEKRCGRLVTR